MSLFQFKAVYGQIGQRYCARFYSNKPLFKYHEGDIIVKIRQETLFKLGEGLEGGEVFRIANPGGDSTHKQFRTEISRDNEVRTLKMLKENEGEIGFYIPEVKASGRLSMDLQDLKGKTIADVFLDPSISNELKQEFLDEYKKAVRKLAAFLAKKYQVPIEKIIDENHVGNVVEFNGRYISLPKVFFMAPDGHFLNSHIDNVLVQHISGQLYLFDPW